MSRSDADQAHSEHLARIAADPRYEALVKKRSRLSWSLTIIMLVVFFGYILLIAFNKALLARPISDGATTLGIPMGIGVILLGIALTGVYVRQANREFDPIVEALKKDSEL